MTAPSRRYEKPCRTCPALLRNDNSSGYCAKCVKSSPEYRAKVAEAAKRRYSDPAERARTGEQVRRAYQADPTIAERKSARMREIASDPEWRARSAESCTRRRLWEKGVAGRTAASHERQGRTFSQRHGIAAWCPADYVEMARDLRRNNVPLDEVKRLVADQQAHDLATIRRRVFAADAAREQRELRAQGLDLLRQRIGLDE